jgi:flagellar hook-associated protein 3 FlgL
MRIATRTRYSHVLPDVHRMQSEQVLLQRQIASGKRILSPGDDPAGYAVSVAHRKELSAATQYARNTLAGGVWVRATDAALEEAIGLFERAGELTISGADETRTASDLAAIAAEVDGLLEQLLAASDMKHRGHAIFGGTRTEGLPFTASRDAEGRIVSVTYNGDGGSREMEILPGKTFAVNFAGSDEAGGTAPAVFRDASGHDLFQVLIDLRDDLLAGNVNAVAGDLAQVEGARGQLSVVRSRLGGVQSRLELAARSQERAELAATECLEEVMGVDMALAAVELAKKQAAYEATLAVAARIMQTSLLDFMR